MIDKRFIRYEIKERLHSPNAIVGITIDGQRHLVLAPVNTLGKKPGDELTSLLRNFLNDQAKQMRADELELLSPPGDTIKETMQEMGIDLPIFTAAMELPVKVCLELLTGTTLITPEIAAKLHKVFNVEAQFWLNRERDYRGKLAALVDPNEVNGA